MPFDEKEKPKLRILSSPEDMRRSYLDFLEKRELWNLWDDPEIKKKYPEFIEYFSQILNKFDLSAYKLTTEVVKSIYIEFIPPGAIQKSYDWDKDPQNRIGVYAGFQRDSHILIVHAFYKTRLPSSDFICWRAKAIQYITGKVIHMPQRLDNQTRLKDHHWCENFDGHFLPVDLTIMLDELKETN